MLLKANVPYPKIFRLEKISYVTFTDNKIIFRHSYSIKQHKNGKLEADMSYIFLPRHDTDEKHKKIEEFKKILHDNGWFMPRGSGSYRAINMDHVSSINFDEKNLRIIFNLDCSITMNGEGNQDLITSDYCYVNYNYFEDFDNDRQYLLDMAIQI